MKKFLLLSCFLPLLATPVRAETFYLDYSTYLGGTQSDRAQALAVDSSRSVFIAGYVIYTEDFPTANPYQGSFSGGKHDAFVARFSSSGSRLLYSTYLGGGDSDQAWGIDVGEDGEAIVGGVTASVDFPTLNSCQASMYGQTDDAFVTRLSASGSEIIFSTYLGGWGRDSGRGVRIGPDGSILIAGSTTSDGFPVVNAYQSIYGGYGDGFLARLSSSGSSILASTYLGGFGRDNCYGLDVVSDGSAWVTGDTESDAFPLQSPYQSSRSGAEIFLSHLSSSGSGLAYSTFFGGYSSDSGYAVRAGTDDVSVTGETWSADFPTLNTYQAKLSASEDAFVFQFSSSGSALRFSTYLGGGGSDSGESLGRQENGDIILAGSTASVDFPTCHPFQSSSQGGWEVFLALLSSSGSSLVASTYLGGGGTDQAKGGYFPPGLAFVAGLTSSTDFPMLNPCQSSLGSPGYFDAFVCRLRLFPSPSPSPTIEGYLTPAPTPSPTPLPDQGLEFGTYLGGSSEERGNSILICPDRSILVAGRTLSSDFPTFEPFQGAPGGGYDAFLSRFSSRGSALLYSTLMGGGGDDWAMDLALASDGSILLFGESGSNDFPTIDPYQASWAGGTSDCFLSRFSSSGSALLYSSYLGGGGGDYAGAFAVGSGDAIFLTGYTDSADFPTASAYQSSLRGGEDAFATKMPYSGSTLLYSTYLGGTLDDRGRGLDCLANGSLAVAGRADSYDFPAKNAYQSNHWGPWADGFLTEISSSGASLEFSTYFGGYSLDEILAIDLSSTGQVVLAGYTYSWDFPIGNPYQSTNNGGGLDAFLSKLSSRGDQLIYSTYLGGYFEDYACDVKIAPNDWIALAGYTQSSDFPTVRPYQSSANSVSPDTEGFATFFHSYGSSLVYSTYLGGSGSDAVLGLDVGPGAALALTGETGSADFPTAGAFQPALGGGETDAFALCLAFPTTPALATPTPAPSPSPSPLPPTPTAAGPTPTPSALPTVTPTAILPSPTPTSAAPSPSPAPTARRIVLDGADFDGDGAGDLALWRSSDASWRVRDVSLVYYGLATDIPVTGDYNGDGGADYAVWRPLTGRWWVRGLYTNSTPLANFYFGTSGDVPVPADYDGDFRTDTAVWRPLNGYWAIKSQTRFYYGMNGDLSVPGDYNGDGRADPAVFRPSLASGVWYIRNISQRAWGLAGDFVTPGDFNGDGTTDLSVFRGYAGRWYTLGSGSVVFGQYGDIPVVIDYDGDGTSDRVLYRPSDGAWRIYGVTSISYGISTDQPAVGETY